MKRFKIYSVVAAGLLALASCADKMDYKEYKIYDKDYINETYSRVSGFMSTIYKDIDYDFGGNFGGAMLSSATDESEYATSGNQIEDFYNGAWGPINSKSWLWTKYYEGIAYCNLFLDQFNDLTFPSYEWNEDYAKQMNSYKNFQWEARWARAFFYFGLVRQYGGVPLMDHVMNADETNGLKRNSADEVFAFIDKECDAIKDSIIVDYTSLGDLMLGNAETGRANQLAVLALKARAALYHASPLFNTSNDKELWHQAALAQKALLDSANEQGRHLCNKYESLWSENAYIDAQPYAEIIFSYREAANNKFESWNFPTGVEGGSGGNCPTQNLVDAYEMKATGLPITDAASGYDETHPYAGRDPRFEATIAHNGTGSGTATDPYWPTYNAQPLETYYNGRNGQPLSTGTPTGYYLKKYCNKSVDLRSGKVNKKNHQYIIFRLGEFYLNYAEAVYRYLGSPYATSAEFPMSAAEAINKVRTRSSMPNLPTNLTNDEFWERYKNERMVELAFEGHRFYDVRRWKEADKYFKSITEMHITKNDDESFTYTRKKVNREWNDKMYLFPLPQSDIIKNPNLEQNPGWNN